MTHAGGMTRGITAEDRRLQPVVPHAGFSRRQRSALEPAVLRR